MRRDELVSFPSNSLSEARAVFKKMLTVRAKLKIIGLYQQQQSLCIHYLTMLEVDSYVRGVFRNYCTSAASAVLLENAEITTILSLAGLAKAARVRHLGMQRGEGRRDPKLSG